MNESITITKTVTREEGTEIMLKAGYPLDMFEERWTLWLDRGDMIIIFENHDMGHPELGHVMTMPWYIDRPIPQHAPDTAQTGLGWRYVPAYNILPS